MMILGFVPWCARILQASPGEESEEAGAHLSPITEENPPQGYVDHARNDMNLALQYSICALELGTDTPKEYA